jgi:hypothetical protein
MSNDAPAVTPREGGPFPQYTTATIRCATAKDHDAESRDARQRLWGRFHQAARCVFAWQLRSGAWHPHLTRADLDDLTQGFLLAFFGERTRADLPGVTNYDPARGPLRPYFRQAAINFGKDACDEAARRAARERERATADATDALVEGCPDVESAASLGEVVALVSEAMAELDRTGKFDWLRDIQAHLTARGTVDRDELRKELAVKDGTLRVRLHRLCQELTPILERLLEVTDADPADRRPVIDAVFQYLGLQSFRRVTPARPAP